jgi:hypothetical protein
MNFWGRIAPRGMPIARRTARVRVTAYASTRSLILLLGPWDLDGTRWRIIVRCGAPLSVYGRGRSVTIMVDMGISRYGVPFFLPTLSGGSRYCVGVSARWLAEYGWLRGGTVRLQGLETLHCGVDACRSDLFVSTIAGIEEGIIEFEDWSEC